MKRFVDAWAVMLATIVLVIDFAGLAGCDHVVVISADGREKVSECTEQVARCIQRACPNGSYVMSKDTPAAADGTDVVRCLPVRDDEPEKKDGTK